MRITIDTITRVKGITAEGEKYVKFTLTMREYLGEELDDLPRKSFKMSFFGSDNPGFQSKCEACEILDTEEITSKKEVKGKVADVTTIVEKIKPSAQLVHWGTTRQAMTVGHRFVVAETIELDRPYRRTKFDGTGKMRKSGVTSKEDDVRNSLKIYYLVVWDEEEQRYVELEGFGKDDTVRRVLSEYYEPVKNDKNKAPKGEGKENEGEETE